MDRLCLVSTVGTSLLTNVAKGGELVTLLRKTANIQENKLSKSDRDALLVCAKDAQKLLASKDTSVWRAASAEVNGLFAYTNRMKRDLKKEDHLVLICTDTYQGELVKELLLEFLTSKFPSSVEIVVPKGLSTNSRYDFITAMNEMIGWCGQALPGYREKGFRIVFNLTGGFKSLMGYMSTVGMLYADEIVYLFESPASELLVIPRLPIILDLPSASKDSNAIEEYAIPLGLLDKTSSLPLDLVAEYNLPESLVEICEIDGEDMVCLSLWAKTLWQSYRKEVLSKNLLDWPYLKYKESFIKDFNNQTDVSIRIALQDSLALISVTLLENKGEMASVMNAKGIGYRPLKSSGVDHFRVNDNFRVTCDKLNKGLLLRRFGPHEINDNP